MSPDVLFRPPLRLAPRRAPTVRLSTARPLLLDEFKGHSLLQAAREADVAKVKKTLALEIISFKHPQTNDTALVRTETLV